jgi:2,6-dihydroxypyridine 3-monooxygenase
MTDRDGVRREVTLPPGAAREAHLRELRAVAADQLAPQLAEVVERTERPFVQVISDIEVERMAFGRVCLLGDAAFALRPHAAAGTAKAAADAWALAEALAASGGDRCSSAPAATATARSSRGAGVPATRSSCSASTDRAADPAVAGGRARLW